MSRNKVILLVGLLLLAYFALPNEGIYLAIKMNMIAIAPYVMVVIIVYLLVVVNLLKKALYRLSEDICMDNVKKVNKLLKYSFDVKRMIGTVNLQSVYKRVNSEKSIGIELKKEFYEILRRKRIDVPLPAGGKR